MKELVCTNCGHNFFVQGLQIKPTDDQEYPGTAAAKVEIESAGVSSADAKLLWVIQSSPAWFCGKCHRQAKRFKFKE